MIEFTEVIGLKADELRLFRPRDVCTALGINSQMLWRMRKAGDFIQPIQISEKAIAFRSDNLLAWINSRKPVDINKDRISLSEMERFERRETA